MFEYVRSRLWLGLAVVFLGFPAPAAAELRVENAGQPAMTSTAPQPPVVVTARGSCPDIYDAPEANGEGGTCGLGAWPGPGGDWGAVLEVAGGDRLLVHSDAALESVEVAATTNFPAGLTRPDGTPVRNETLAGPVRAEPTGPTQTTHAVTLPPLDPRASSGLAFAIVTGAADGSRQHYALAIRTPRKDRYGESCGIAWYAPDWQIDQCAGGTKGPPPPNMSPPPPVEPVTPAAVAAPRAPVLAAAVRRIGRNLAVRVSVVQDGSVRAELGGLQSAWTAVRAGRWHVVRVPLRAGRRLPRRVTVRVTLRTTTGTVSVRRRLVVHGVR